MPQLGETVTEGTITKWFKAVGDTVARDEPLFEVSTDKVDSEVPSPADGVLTAILVEEGDTVDVGVALAVIDGDARRYEAILADPQLGALIDFSEPACVLFVSMLHFLTAGQADAIVAAAAGSQTDDLHALFLTKPLGEMGHIDGLMVSGGVGEYAHGRESRDFGDLGRALGHALRARLDAGALPFPLLPPGECIRATVLGASEHSVQLSGDTIYISSHAALLPRRNLPVLRPRLDLSGAVDPVAAGAAIMEHRAAFDRLDPSEPFALSLPWRGEPSYERVRALAEGVAKGLADMIGARTPLYLLVVGDLALTIGAILKRDMAIASEVLAIDGVAAGDFDYIDLGRLRLPSHTLPATIKSVLFGAAANAWPRPLHGGS